MNADVCSIAVIPFASLRNRFRTPGRVLENLLDHPHHPYSFDQLRIGFGQERGVKFGEIMSEGIPWTRLRTDAGTPPLSTHRLSSAA